MAKYKVVTQKPAGVTFDLADSQYRLEMEALDAIDAEIVEIDASTEDEFIASAKNADALIARGRPITKKIIDSLENCKVISLGSVGADNVDVGAATEKGIPVTNVPDTFIEEVADHTMMLLLASFRRLNIMDQMVRENRWAEGRPLLSEFPRLWGQTLGLISFGHVAKAVAIRAKAFGLRLIAFDPYIEELSMTEYGVQPISTLEEMLSMSDIVSMHAPSTGDAFHLMSEPQFKSMKPTGLFINNGRGPTVDEEALIKALEQKWIAGAGLDVFEQEPPDPENPLLHMENVILTPHVASASQRMAPETRRRVGKELSLVLTGRWPRSCVNPAVLADSGLKRWQPYSMGRGPGAG
ncbi:MAG: D-3-phosphoglycerate dehydrogenase [Chloroflexi bacterium]|jgi:D-3-phosphoglycerate dehydrogenase|nr:MAG: D-3-phosphoglycerate dehydrogenase [Chloroflexota bacterium]